MNFLAHAYLSDNDENVIIGNFIADRVKGKGWENYSGGIKTGILLHRFIDHFTDTHAVNRESARILQPYFGKYSAVVTDVVNDHFLSVHWDQFHSEKRNNFIHFTYEILQKNISVLPEQSQMMLPFMVKQDWLGSYITLEGISDVLRRMSKRTPFVSNMEKSIVPLQSHYPELEHNFHQFFPELNKASRAQLKELRNHE